MEEKLIEEIKKRSQLNEMELKTEVVDMKKELKRLSAIIFVNMLLLIKKGKVVYE